MKPSTTRPYRLGAALQGHCLLDPDALLAVNLEDWPAQHAIASQVERRARCMLGQRGRAMPHGDWVTAIASIIAVIVGGFVTYLFDRYRATRKALRFVLQPPERISEGLKRHGTFIEIKIGENIIENLNVATVTVKNVSNVQLENVSFDMVVPGNHPLVLADCAVDDSKLRQAIKIDFDPTASQLDRRFTVSLPFFNKGETFDLKTFFDDPPNAPRIECRLAGISTRIDTPEEFRSKEALDRRLVLVGMGVIFATLAIVIAAVSLIASRNQQEADFARHIIELQMRALASPSKATPDVLPEDRKQ
jgi:hypothetical protein